MNRRTFLLCTGAAVTALAIPVEKSITLLEYIKLNQEEQLDIQRRWTRHHEWKCIVYYI